MLPYHQTVVVTEASLASDDYHWRQQATRVRDLACQEERIEALRTTVQTAWSERDALVGDLHVAREEIARLQVELIAAARRELVLRAQVIEVDLLGVAVRLRDERWHRRNAERIALLEEAGELL